MFVTNGNRIDRDRGRMAGVFGAKIVCENCNKKAKEKTSIYRRGSRFCSEACRDTWQAANPPPVARGEHAGLRQELVMVLDEALAESQRDFSSLGPEHELEALKAAFQLFQSYVLRAAPIMRALGFDAEATMIDSTDFQRGSSGSSIGALAGAREFGPSRSILGAVVGMRRNGSNASLVAALVGVRQQL